MVNVSNTIIKKIGQKITNNDNEEKSDQKKKPLSVWHTNKKKQAELIKYFLR